jgi:hypothetical protein
MAQFLTIISVLGAAGFAAWWYRDLLVHHLFHRGTIQVTIKLDREAPGAHIIWNVTNVGSTPITITKLIIHGSKGSRDLPLMKPKVLGPSEGLLLPTDVDWSVLSARSIAVVDGTGHEHEASRRELALIQDHLRQHIDRRVTTGSARDFLVGAADFAMGVVILGLGFFMLMWVIATG